MRDLYWLTDEQMGRLRPFFPKSHGKPRVDDHRVLSGIIFVNRNGLRCVMRSGNTVHTRRNGIEIMFGRLKDWRRVATCYDRCLTVFFSPSASQPPPCSGYEA